MEFEKKNKKRVRDNEEDDHINLEKPSSSSAKKQYSAGDHHIHMNDYGDEHMIKLGSKEISDEAALGVFDFPWLHEEESWKSGGECDIFEDTFSSSLEEYTWFEFSGHCCYRWGDISTSMDLRYYNFEENVLWPLKGDVGLEMDTIWSYLQQQGQAQAQAQAQAQDVSESNNN